MDLGVFANHRIFQRIAIVTLNGTLSLTELKNFEEDIWVLKRELGSKARNWKIR